MDAQADEDIKSIIFDLNARLQFGNITEIKCWNGAQIGDGFGSKPLAVEVRNGQNKYLQLFLKCSIGNENGKETQQQESYANEIFFYETIYPIYKKFVENRNLQALKYAPKYYGIYKQKSSDIIILENLRAKGYTLFDRTKLMDDSHLGLVLRTFARFHATSFALKDQNPELHEELCAKCYDITPSMAEMGFYKLLKDMFRDFLSKLDPVGDKDILDALDHKVIERAVDYARDSHKYATDHFILTKGDCWCNNMMILYEDESERKPLDLMLIDWQLVRKASPVHDIMNLFFSVISEEALRDYQRYLKIYHEELSRCILELGSDPNLLYPYEVLVDEWKEFSPFGFAIAIILIKMMLSGINETPNFSGMKSGEEFASVEEFIPTMRKEDEYIRRMKYVTRYFIRNNFL